MDLIKYNLLKETCVLKRGKLLTKNSTEINSSTKLKYSCNKGHTWETTYISILNGTWCDKCRRVEMFERVRENQYKKIITLINKIVKEKRGTIITSNYTNQQSKFKFQCNEGHIFETRPDLIIKRGTWCDKCSRKEKLERESKLNGIKTKLELIEVVKKNKGEILDGEYINIKSKFKFKCKEGHVWETTPYLIIKGRWCKKCSSKISSDRQRGSIEPILKYLKERGGKYISGDYINQHTSIKIQCENGHVWDVKPNSLLSKKSWCRECLGTKKRNIEEMTQIGIERGGKCISNEYINDFTKLVWECSEGHTFSTSPNNIKHGKWCPECSSGFYERVCRFYFEKIFDKPFFKIRPDWLKNPVTNHNLELDGYNEELKIGFEHQGIQHYKKESFFHNPEILENDKLKKDLCKLNGVNLIEIPELISITKLKDLKNFIYTELNKLKITPKKSIDDLVISQYDLYTYTKNKERNVIEKIVIERLKNKDFKVINFKYDGNHKVDVECSNNHISSFLVGKVFIDLFSCKRCVYVNIETGNKVYPNIGKEKVFGKEVLDKTKFLKDKVERKINVNGSKLLHGEIINGNSILEIECSNSHIYKSNVSNIIRRECPECSRMNKININSLFKSIQNKGGKVLNYNYSKGEYLIRIECKNNHIYNTTNFILRKSRVNGCKECKLLNKQNKKDKRLLELNDHLKEINGICLDYTPNKENKLKFNCVNNHTFYSTLNNVLYGYWCKKCSNTKRTTDTLPNRKNKVLNFIKSKNGNLLSKELNYDYDDKIMLECKRNHIWESSIRSIMNNQWCRTCGLLDRWEKNKMTIEGINNLIKDRDGKCLSKEYKNSSKDKLIFQCKEGHIWESIWSNVKRGSWCPSCSLKKIKKST